MAPRARPRRDRGVRCRPLALEDDDGQWAGGTFLPRDFEPSEWEEVGQPWTATTFALSQLRELGLDPTSESAMRAVRLVGENARWWDDDDYPFWGGETEECINGRVVADGAYFGVDMAPLVGRLLGEQMEDGGWNCERPNGSTRSSFATTINVLEGLLEHELATGGTEESRAARRAGEEFLLQRRLFRRLSTGAPADEAFLASSTRTGGATTCCVRSTTSAPPPLSVTACPIPGWPMRSTTCVPGRLPTGGGCSTTPRGAAPGSPSTTAWVCRRGG